MRITEQRRIVAEVGVLNRLQAKTSSQSAALPTSLLDQAFKDLL
jgi:hypothetical protein